MIDFVIEIRKAKYRKLWMIAAGVIVIQFFWISWGMHSSREGKELTDAFYTILYQIPLMNTILLPLCLGALSSRIWDIEHKGETFKLLCTMQKRENIYRFKTLYGFMYIMLIGIFQIVLMLVIENIFKTSQTLPLNHVIYMFISTLAVSIVIYLIQQIFTFSFKNQLVPLSIGLFGSFLGLFSAFFPMQIQKFVIWAYYAVLSTIGMNWDRDTRIITYFEQGYNVKVFGFILCLGVIVYFLGKKLFMRREV